MPQSAASLKPKLHEISERELQRYAFLKSDAKSLIALPSDASKRQYFRYDKGLLMDTPTSENPAQFMNVANYLRNLGFSTPQIFNHDLDLGFLALEDFGDNTFTQLLKLGEDPYSLYELAVDTLIELHQKADIRPDFINHYDVQPLLREAELLVDWYIPHTLGKSLSLNDKKNYLDLWQVAFHKALSVPHSLTLRDYHVDNLMRLEGRTGIQSCGLLDFQDALWGPIVYDLVSLVEDARIDLNPALVEHCWQRYLAGCSQHNGDALRSSGCILSAGRHAKIIGIFTRLAIRDGKSKYLTHIPRIQRLLQNCLEHPELHKLKGWFHTHLEN
jgi:N-acetylmuramate 1-kinase